MSAKSDVKLSITMKALKKLLLMESEDKELQILAMAESVAVDDAGGEEVMHSHLHIPTKPLKTLEFPVFVAISMQQEDDSIVTIGFDRVKWWYDVPGKPAALLHKLLYQLDDDDYGVTVLTQEYVNSPGFGHGVHEFGGDLTHGHERELVLRFT